MEIVIIGAGLAGLIVSKVLEHHDVTVYEKNNSLPNNHKAVLRFKTNAVGNLINKDFKFVNVQKGIYDNGIVNNSIIQNNKYSKKVTNEIMIRSISDTSTKKRFICDFNLQKYLAKNLKIKYNHDFKIRKSADASVPLISTIPMPILMDVLGYKNKPEFKSKSINVLVLRIKNCDVYQTIYYTSSYFCVYRATITKNILIIESTVAANQEQITIVLNTFGLDEYDVACEISDTHQEYGKLVPIDKSIIKEFIGWATKEYNIYSIGRYATWRNIQLDDVVIDSRKIKKAIENKGYFL